jgi:hypothetical protein
MIHRRVSTAAPVLPTVLPIENGRLQRKRNKPAQLSIRPWQSRRIICVILLVVGLWWLSTRFNLSRQRAGLWQSHERRQRRREHILPTIPPEVVREYRQMVHSWNQTVKQPSTVVRPVREISVPEQRARGIYPRVVLLSNEDDESFVLSSPSPQNTNFSDASIRRNRAWYQRRTARIIYFPMSTPYEQGALEDSADYDGKAADPFETKDCTAMRPWQSQSFPTCSLIHEYDLSRIGDVFSPGYRPRSIGLQHSSDSFDYRLGGGYWRDVWSVRYYQEQIVLKTLRYHHDATARVFDRHRRDALVMERLSYSPWIVDIYGYCGNSGLFAHADGGDVTNAIWPEGSTDDATMQKRDPAHSALSKMKKLHIGKKQLADIGCLYPSPTHSVLDSDPNGLGTGRLAQF